jgi:hypothetical protein
MRYSYLAPIWPTTATNPFDCSVTDRLITQRSQVQILPPQPIPAKSAYFTPPLSSSDSGLAHLWPTGFSAFSLRNFSTAFHPYLTLQDGLQHRRLANIGVSVHQKFFLPPCKLFVTVLVRQTVPLFVFLGHAASLHRLCVAHLCAKGVSNEKPIGFVLRLCSGSSLVCVYACWHAQRCASSRTRPGRRSASVSPSLSRPTGRQAGRKESPQEVTLMQGASVWRRLAY